MDQLTGNIERKTYCDYLRVIATFAVVILHVSAQNWRAMDVNGFEWKVFNFYDSIVRWGVPVFVMISGSLFLNKAVSIKKLYTKYIRRMIVAFITWSIFYVLVNEDTLRNGIIYGLKTHKKEIISGHYHMWFILMIIGIYICIPFYKKLVEDRLIMKYFLTLSFLFAFFIPWILQLLKDYVAGNIGLVEKAIGVINTNISNMNMHMVLGYSFYFIFGYYLDNIELSKKQRIIIYILGIAGFLFTILVDLDIALKTQHPCSIYYGEFRVNVVSEAVCIYTLYKYRRFENVRLNFFVKKLSGYTFGVYLVHALFIEKFSSALNFNTLSFNAVISVPVIACVVFACSLLISTVINHIPILKENIV